MNNDSPPSSDLPAAASTSQEASVNQPPEVTAASREQQQTNLSPAQKRIQAQTKKKYEFVNSLMANLDALIYAELCILYYMDCSLFRLLLRTITQLMFLTPKPNFIPPIPQQKPYVGPLFVTNFMCIILHLFTARSAAGEAMRGYLHGGVIIDLIGQKGPTSRIHLLLLDVLVLALQCLMLAVHVEREKLASSLAAFIKPGADAGVPRAQAPASQDHNSEERGLMRDGVMDNGDIEMQPLSSRLNGPSTRNDGAGSESEMERTRLLDGPLREQLEDDDSPLDLFWSGTAVIADFHVLDTLRHQWYAPENASASALQTVGFSAELANRRFAAAHQRFQRGVESLAN